VRDDRNDPDLRRPGRRALSREECPEDVTTTTANWGAVGLAFTGPRMKYDQKRPVL
jgi:hypothetical protein